MCASMCIMISMNLCSLKWLLFISNKICMYSCKTVKEILKIEYFLQENSGQFFLLHASAHFLVLVCVNVYIILWFFFLWDQYKHVFNEKKMLQFLFCIVRESKGCSV